MIRFYCGCCGDHQEVEIEPLKKDDLNPDPWGDIVCKTCHFVIATVSADEEGVYQFVKIDGLGVYHESVTRAWDQYGPWVLGE